MSTYVGTVDVAAALPTAALCFHGSAAVPRTKAQPESKNTNIVGEIGSPQRATTGAGAAGAAAAAAAAGAGAAIATLVEEEDSLLLKSKGWRTPANRADCVGPQACASHLCRCLHRSLPREGKLPKQPCWIMLLETPALPPMCLTAIIREKDNPGGKYLLTS